MEDGNVIIKIFIVHWFPMEMFSITISCHNSDFYFCGCILSSILYKDRDHFLSCCLIDIIVDWLVCFVYGNMFRFTSHKAL